MSAIEHCRTAALGGQVEACPDCGHWRIAYNSCRNRHCPKCQGVAARSWLEAREADLLPVGYFHVVFTLPAEVAAIAYFFFSSRRRHTSSLRDWSSDVCSSDLSCVASSKKRTAPRRPRVRRPGNAAAAAAGDRLRGPGSVLRPASQL